ncbi:sugar transferase [Pseudoalteromonas luteoviolacea]|uniref:sugar transferase n=1 Tax=Pseudoalteromonas luteoviolacea TaxID=43657 RepID=UPI001B36679A|nr:sugar transferase [Pseudoalteromonas luteoviolacea]MBQ4812036.1 sugar transferase [Pseudoalteromonas luteoviolacea]
MYKNYLKYIIDFLAALLLITILSPLILLSFLVIKLEDPKGPVIFRQKRIGLKGREFLVFKLRSMRVETQDASGKELNDSERMLKYGELFRKLSVDELPQLFNILKGDMSFIGPRPLPIIYAPYYNEEENRRHDIKPGISGWAQVNGRNSITWEDKFKLDIEYVDNINFLFDLKIAFLTVYKVFSKSDVVVRGNDTNVDFHTYRKEQNNGK